MMDLITIARPEDVDLAVPPLTPGQSSGLTLRQIADGYSKYVTRDWARAVNVEYRAGPSGPSVSLIAEGSKVWTIGDPRWPVMMATGGVGGVVIKEAPSEAEIKAARWAFSAGPWLVRDGRLTNITSELSRCGFSGLMEGSQRERAAIGIRDDGCLVHYATMSATLPQVAFQMLALGCRDAIGLDGGGSVGAIDPSGKVLIGYTSRQVCCALIFRQLVDEHPAEVPQPPQPKGGDKQMIVCIDPGHGGPDPGCVGPDGTQEKVITLYVATRLAEYLRRGGAKVVLTRTTDTDLAPGLDDEAEIKARARVGNDAGAGYYISIHVNWFSSEEPEGAEAFYWPGSVKGEALARAIMHHSGIASGLPLRRIDPAKYMILGYTQMPAVLVELAFLSNKADRALLKEPAWLDRYALGIAFGILAMRA